MLLQDRLRETKERRRSLDHFKPHTLPLSTQQPERTLTPRSREQHKHIIRQSGDQIQPKDFSTPNKNSSFLHQGKNSHTSTPAQTQFSSSEDLHRYQTSQERDETTLRIAAFVGAGDKLGLGLQQDKAGEAITISGLANDGSARRCEVIWWVCVCVLEFCRGLQHERAGVAFTLSGLVDDDDVRRCDLLVMSKEMASGPDLPWSETDVCTPPSQYRRFSSCNGLKDGIPGLDVPFTDADICVFFSQRGR